MIGKELQRDDVDDALDVLVRLRHSNQELFRDLVKDLDVAIPEFPIVFRDLGIVLIAEDNGPTAAGSDDLESVAHFLMEIKRKSFSSLRPEFDHRNPFLPTE